MKRYSTDRRVFDRRKRFMTALAMLVLASVVVVNAAAAVQAETQPLYLYFADAASPFLVAEARAMAVDENPLIQGRRLVTALIDGSMRGHLQTIPAGTRLRSFFLLDDATAVVDFSGALRERHPGGCRMAQLTLFSIVNTLVLNIPAIERVKILIDGVDSPTLTGHLSLAYPLTADMLLTR